jgi:HEAT repeat protein
VRVLWRLMAIALALCAAGAVGGASCDDSASADEELLRSAGLRPEARDLIEFFRQRTLTDEHHRQFERLIHELGDERYEAREAASRRLVAAGPPVLPFLRRAVKDADLEVARRAEGCVSQIERGPGASLTTAAVRALVRLNPSGALPALLNYFPFADDEWVEDEVLTGVGRLGARQGRIDPILYATLRDLSARGRAAAAFVVGRVGSVEDRRRVRPLLTDPDAKVRTLAGRGLLGDLARRISPDRAADEKVVRDGGVGTDAAGLAAFFARRTLSDERRQQIESLVRQLGSHRFMEREEASRKLLAEGPPVLPFLRKVVQEGDLEMARRAESCAGEITRGPGPAVPVAAARLVSAGPPAGAVALLLRYLPYADDELVEEEVLFALGELSVRQAGIDPALTAALQDPLPARRAAAARLLGQVGEPEQCTAARRLLSDPDPKVRLHAAHGLLAAKDRDAVPVLLALLASASPNIAGLAEGLLRRVAGDEAPNEIAGQGSEEAGQKGRAAWAAWWRDHGGALDLSRMDVSRRQLGLTIVAELDSNKVWEFGLDGRVRRQLTNLEGPIDAEVLPGGRVLVAEHQAQRVTERDLHGRILWEKKVTGNPITCQRLPNGNTFIATYNHLLEVTRDGREVYTRDTNAGPRFPVFGAHRRRDGHVACISAQGTLTETDPAAGKLVRSVQVANNGGWCGVEALPGDRFLVAMSNQNRVAEIDAAGKTVWECSVPGASHATRLANGHTMVACMTTRRLVEVDARGKTVWEKKTDGRPFHVHRR